MNKDYVMPDLVRHPVNYVPLKADIFLLDSGMRQKREACPWGMTANKIQT
jgi:hypothetical protein